MKTALQDWNAEAKVAEKAELRDLLADRGILVFDARTLNAEHFDQDLVRQVRNEWYAKVSKPSMLAVFAETFLGIPANRI